MHALGSAGLTFFTFFTFLSVTFAFLFFCYLISFFLSFSATDNSESFMSSWTFISSLSYSESDSESAWTASRIPACDLKAIAYDSSAIDKVPSSNIKVN